MSKLSDGAIRNLHKFFPKRAKMLMEALFDANASEAQLEHWREQQIAKFIEMLIMNARELERGFTDKQIATVAWAARNILEVSVWIDYCNVSDAHAIRFRDDAARDLLGFSKAIQAMHMDTHGNVNADLELALQKLADMAEDVLGISDLKEDYARVRNAAKELGREDEFVNLNKMFSKLAHPTALAMNTILNIEPDKDLREMFLADGVSRATESLVNIREYMQAIFLSGREAAQTANE